MKENILCLLMTISAISTMAQPVAVELMVGRNLYWYQHTLARKIGNSEKAGFFHVSSMHAFFGDNRNSEIMSQSYFTYVIMPGVTGTLGTHYSSGPGWAPSIAIQLYKRSGDFTLMLVPRADILKRHTFDAMTLIEFTPRLFGELRLYTRMQAMSNFSENQHNRSYQNFRIGINVRKVQVGAAINIDEYGSETKTHHNTGFFLKTAL